MRGTVWRTVWLKSEERGTDVSHGFGEHVSWALAPSKSVQPLRTPSLPNASEVVTSWQVKAT